MITYPACNLCTAIMMDGYMNGTNTSEEDSNGRKKRQSSSTNTIELMVYVDAGVQNDANQHGFSVIDYILGIINIVSNIILVHFAMCDTEL